MDRKRHSVMELHDIECRSCNMPWSILVNNNSQWPNSYDRGAHNFHFRKSVETDSQQKQSSTVKVQEEINFR
jgi:hypothetical protein